MADNNAQVENNGSDNNSANAEVTPNQAGQIRTFTQAEVDAIVKQRLERERTKHNDDIANAEAKRQEAEEALNKATAERDALQAEKARREMIEKISTETGMPVKAVSMLSGATEAELKANAEALRAAMPAYPVTKDSGTVNTAPITRAQIDSIKDRNEREKMMLEHLDLYK